MLPTSSPQTIAIIGGGFSGVMVATQLLRHATQPLQIKLIEPRATLGQGTAYSTGFDCHLLNVPAGKISAFPDQPDHFLEWLRCRQVPSPWATAETVHAGMFVSRRLYGDYIQSLLPSVLAEAQQRVSGVQLDWLQDEATAVKSHSQGPTVYLKSGRMLSVHQVVLALGNLPPADPVVADRGFYQSQRYIRNPWSNQALQQIDLDQPLLLIGSGLTMLDWAIALHQRGFRSTMHVISRRGLLPQTHQPTLPYCITPPNRPHTTRSLLRWLRQEIKLAQQQGSDWRAVIDGLRPYTQTIWQSLSLIERQRFLRHVRPYWEVHRHRVAPEVAKTIHHLIQTGQLQLWTGRIQDYREQTEAVEIYFRARPTNQIRCLTVSTVVNCTGATCNYNRFHHPLIAGLLQAGLVLPDPLGLGLEVAANGALIEANGRMSNWLFTLGPTQKGHLWETTAVPELRQQAATLAQQLLQTHQSSCSESYQISKSRSFRYSKAL